MRIQHNIAALNSYRNLTNNNSAVAKNLEKLSSGYRINRAGDDAAGLAISEKMRAQITGLKTAQKNSNDGISLVQTAEGALTEVHSMLNRMVELAGQSANGTYADEVDRENLQKEIDSLKDEINRIAKSTNFNGINLLDGSLSTANLSTEGISTNTIDMAAGVEITQGTNGGGSKGEYTIDLTNAFGDGDTIDLTFGGLLAAEDFTGDGSQDGTLTLAYGTDFSGNSIEEQAKEIARSLNGNSSISKNFTVTADGASIKLTAIEEGNDSSKVATVTNVTASDKELVADTSWKQTAAKGNTSELISKIDNFNATKSGVDLNDGDEVTLAVKLDANTTLNLKLIAGTDFKIGDTNEATLNNIKDALNSDKAKFTDNEKTAAIDESKIKFNELFEVSVDSGTSLEFKSLNSFVAANGITLSAKNTSIASAQKTAAVTTQAATKDSYVIAPDATKTDGTNFDNAQNLALGDKLTIKGELLDGRKFEFDVEAGKGNGKLEIGTTWANTMANLETLLETNGLEITLDDGSKVNTKDIFGTGKEIDFTAATGKFESTRAGTVGVSKVTDVEFTKAGVASLEASLSNGTQQSAATSTINFSAGVEYGSVIKVNGQNYEIVKNEDDTTAKGNKAVVVKDLTDANSIAKAMADTLKKDLDTAEYAVSASGSKVTIKTTDVGSTAKAATISSSGDKVTQLEFALDPEKFQNNASVTINGQKYEFVEKGGKTKDANATAIEVDNFAKATSSSLGSLLADTANGVKNAQVLVDADGKVTVRGLADTSGKIETPTVKFADGKGGLVLQIGDTSADFNKLKVSIGDTHTTALGLDGVNVGTQEGAAAAVDMIKSAINGVSEIRGTLGAVQNRLEHTINNLSVTTENITAAESRIRDVDMAEEMMAYTKNNILVQAAQAMLAQANQVPQGVLQLLQ